MHHVRCGSVPGLRLRRASVLSTRLVTRSPYPPQPSWQVMASTAVVRSWLNIGPARTKAAFKAHSCRIRRKRQRLPSRLLIENASARRARLCPGCHPPRRFRSRLATTRTWDRFRTGGLLTLQELPDSALCVSSACFTYKRATQHLPAVLIGIADRCALSVKIVSTTLERAR